MKVPNTGKSILVLQLAALLFAIGSLTSCKKGNPSWDTGILAPLVTASMSINNLLPDTLVKINPDSSVTLVYNSSVTNISTDSLVNMPDTTLIYSYSSPVTTNVSPGQTVIPTNNSPAGYNISTVQLKKAIIQSGYVDIEVTSQVNQVTDYTYTVPSATLNNKPLVLYIKAPAGNSTTPGYAKKTYSLANYQIDFRGPSGNGYNIIQTILNGIIDSAAGTAAITPGTNILITATFRNIVPYYAQGYFGTITKTYTQQASFPLFNHITAGSLALQNINVNMTLENQFGVDAIVNVSQLSSINARTNSTVNLTDAALINNNINVNRATQTYNPASPVSSSVQNFALTTSNSNILNWVNNLPAYIGYSIQVTTDPLGNVSGSNDFAFQGYGINTDLNISIPLSLIANNLTLEDTLSVNFSSVSKNQPVKSGTLTLYATNGFPFSAGMQVYLLDNNLKIADSLMLTSQTIAAGIMNGNGIVVTPQNSVINIPLNAAQTQQLFNAKHIIILSRFNMGCQSCLPPAYRKIYNYYILNVKLVGNFDFQVNG